MDLSTHKLNIKYMHKYLIAWRKSKGIVKKLDEGKRSEKLVLRMQKTTLTYPDVFFPPLPWTGHNYTHDCKDIPAASKTFNLWFKTQLY